MSGDPRHGESTFAEGFQLMNSSNPHHVATFWSDNGINFVDCACRWQTTTRNAQCAVDAWREHVNPGSTLTTTTTKDPR